MKDEYIDEKTAQEIMDGIDKNRYNLCDLILFSDVGENPSEYEKQIRQRALNKLKHVSETAVRLEHYIQVEELCSAFLISIYPPITLSNGSKVTGLSADAAIEKIHEMIEHCTKNGFIPQLDGDCLMGEYYKRCKNRAKEKGEGRNNGYPLGLIHSLKYYKGVLKNPVTDTKNTNDDVQQSSNETIPIYERHAARLKELGVVYTVGTLKNWLETKFPNKHKFWTEHSIVEEVEFFCKKIK